MTRLTQSTLSSRIEPYDATIVSRLFKAILAHDDIYPDAKLPGYLPLAENEDEIAQCFFHGRRIVSNDEQYR
jgi:hypothetical protein